MAYGDSVEITDVGAEGYAIHIKLVRPDPNDVRGAVEALIANKEESFAVANEQVRHGTIREPSAPQDEQLPPNVVPIRTQEDEEPEQTTPEALAKEYRNLEKLNDYLYQGRVVRGDGRIQPFDMTNWREGIKSFCSHIHLKEAEHLLSEYVADRRAADSTDDESDFE